MDSGSVVVVTADVRMGPLGWLSAEDPVLPGNLGLRDSMAALRWVGANAASFGGDAGRVTLVGHSAGAAEAEALLTTDRAKGLFHKVGTAAKIIAHDVVSAAIAFAVSPVAVASAAFIGSVV